MNGQEGGTLLVVCSINGHRHGRVVVFETRQTGSPEFSGSCVRYGTVRWRQRWIYLGPQCPSLILRAKSMCIRVTSAGRTAAPVPSFMFNS